MPICIFWTPLSSSLHPPFNVGSSAFADDEFLISDSQTKLQALLGIVEYYGRMYKVTYGANKTKITVVGSDQDMKYYSDTMPWHIDEMKVKVCEDNDHLGQIVSGIRQEQKNVDLRISKGRNNLFGMLGPAFSFKCLLSPKVKVHLFRTYTCPIIRSGLSSFSLRTSDLQPLAVFHRKILRGILNLSKCASNPAIHFLLGELPIEAKIHRDIFSLFYNVWLNPDSKIYKIVKYLLETSPDNSRTWSIHLRHLCQKYELKDPLKCLESDPPSKSSYKTDVNIRIQTYHEKTLRIQAENNSVMQYLNTSLYGLNGRCHPALANLVTSHQVKKARIHLKMLAGNFLTYEMKSNQSGGSSHCRCCVPPSPSENLEHIISVCNAYSDIRKRMIAEYTILCSMAKSSISWPDIVSDKNTFCQFVLDPASFNLIQRININDPILGSLFEVSRDFCFAINTTRQRILGSLPK